MIAWNSHVVCKQPKAVNVHLYQASVYCPGHLVAVLLLLLSGDVETNPGPLTG